MGTTNVPIALCLPVHPMYTTYGTKHSASLPAGLLVYSFRHEGTGPRWSTLSDVDRSPGSFVEGGKKFVKYLEIGVSRRGSTGLKAKMSRCTWASSQITMAPCVRGVCPFSLSGARGRDTRSSAPKTAVVGAGHGRAHTFYLSPICQVLGFFVASSCLHVPYVLQCNLLHPSTHPLAIRMCQWKKLKVLCMGH